MKTIYISGHKNPDMDSVCSAYAYAVLKNAVHPEVNYVPIRCGALNPQTKAVFSALNMTPPALMTDISPRVESITKTDLPELDMNAPVYTAIDELDKKTLSMIPVKDSNHDFMGTVSIHEISAFLVRENLGSRPRYNFIPENIPRVVPGRVFSEGTNGPFTAPLMIGAMPYEISIDRIARLGSALPLLVVGLRRELIDYAVKENFPGIILTGIRQSDRIDTDFSDYNGFVYISEADTAETARLLRLSSPVKDIVKTDIPHLQADTTIDEAKRMLLASDLRGLPVFKEGTFIGVVTRRCFIEPPKTGLIMVDHNEMDQSVQGADSAVLLEIVDHHRISLPDTREPIHVDVQPLGSTCTIIYGKFKSLDIKPDAKTATVLLSGILSDTVLLKSPTSTKTDEQAIQALSAIAGLDWEDWGNEIFSHAATLKGTDPDRIVNGDFKTYEHKGIRFGIGQVEVTAFEDIHEV
ncbi:MAG: putative manganese-dependent inorganic diphosphatase, partial [Spirochaetales bacterium]|nr:putative manganese-dependent inorganic diphosphatase [Spirochaetales bacterium]